MSKSALMVCSRDLWSSDSLSSLWSCLEKSERDCECSIICCCFCDIRSSRLSTFQTYTGVVVLLTDMFQFDDEESLATIVASKCWGCEVLKAAQRCPVWVSGLSTSPCSLYISKGRLFVTALIRIIIV